MKSTLISQDSHIAIKTAIIETCRALEKLGYVIGMWGNVSVRVPEGMIVTPTRLGYDVMTTDDFVTVSLADGAVISGHRLPSSEAGVHRLILRKKADVGAIIHCHSPHATAVSCLGRPIPAIVEDLAQIVGGRVNCTRYVPAGRHEKIAEEVANTIGEENAVLLANHGVFCCGRTLQEAFVVCQVVEKAAQMLLLAGNLGPVKSIPEEFVRSERDRFLHTYGTANDNGS